MRIKWQLHPSASTKTISEIEDEIFLEAIEQGVAVCKGSFFSAERNEVGEDMFFRATFAAASEEKMTEAIERFGRAVKHVFLGA